MTPDLAAIRERHSRATKGPWEFSDLTGMIFAGDKIITDIDVSSSINLYDERDANGSFIGNSWQDIDTLLRHVESQAARIAELESRLAGEQPLESEGEPV
jgi:hypothetical protein